MKVKSIKNISSDARYIIKVFDGENFVESFIIDYLDMSMEELTATLCNKYFKYENKTVRRILSTMKNGKSYLEISVNA